LNANVGVHINNRYQLIDLIGSGSMGSVYTAIDRLTGKTVALKQMASVASSSPSTIVKQVDHLGIALAREFKILASLRHPHIISVQDYGFDESHQPYFTMEYLPQTQTLLDFGKDQPHQTKIGLLVQLLQALIYLHRCGVLHRDLKPANVVVVDGQVKVLDFGLAVQKDAGKDNKEISGTVIYMAPEVIRGTPASVASDLYAVGVIAYELFGERHPFNTLMDVLETYPDTASLPIKADLQAVIDRLLQKQPQNRYADAETTLHALAQAAGLMLPPETSAIQESFLEAAKFVGRDKELQLLANALRDAIQGNGSAWLIGGESGVGKSRLMAELDTQALVEGALVLRGRGIAEGGAPYRVWHTVLRRLCLHTEVSDFEAGVLKPLIPNIHKLINRPVPDAPTIDPTAAQNRLLTAIENIFIRQTQPIVILLGDLQWAHESLVVLRMLNRLVSRLPLLILANYRDDERPELPDLLPEMRLITLTGLKRDAIMQLSQSMLGESEQQEQIADLLEHETEGNAFLIVEAIRSLAEQAGQLAGIGRMVLPASLLPDGMKMILRSRLNHIPEQARGLLYAAAVAGRDLDIALLKALEPETNIAQWLTFASPVLSVTDDRYRFAHDKLREALLSDLDAAHRRQLHRRIADAIETIHPSDSRYYQILAVHYNNAAMHSQEARYATLAGEDALKNGLFEEAVSYLKRMVELHMVLPVEASQKATVIRMLSTAYMGLGDFENSRKSAEEALRLLGVRMPKTDTELGIALFREVTKQLLYKFMRGRWMFRHRAFDSQKIQDISTLLLHLGYIYEFECEKIFALWNTLKAINLVEIENFVPLRAVAYYFAAILYQAKPLSSLHLADGYVARGEEALTQGQNDTQLYGHALLVKAAYGSMHGDWEVSMETISQARTFFAERGAVRDVDNMLGLEVHCEFLMGDWDHCYANAEFVYESAQKRNDTQAALGSLMWMLSYWIRRGQWDQARVVLAQAPELLRHSHSRSMIIWSGAMMGLAHYKLGDVQAARRTADPALKIVQAKAPISNWLHEPISALSELYLNLWHDGDAACRPLAKTACHALKNLSNVFRVSQPSASVWQGLYHFENGQHQLAEHFWKNALEHARTYRTPYYEGLAHYYLAHKLPDTSHTGHSEAAVQLLNRLGAVPPDIQEANRPYELA
jgi:eukaryotic-like serine/threonine-protein kinase